MAGRGKAVLAGAWAAAADDMSPTQKRRPEGRLWYDSLWWPEPGQKLIDMPPVSVLIDEVTSVPIAVSIAVFS